MHTQNCDIMQIFRIMCKGLYLEIFLIQRVVCGKSKDRSLVAAGEACCYKAALFQRMAALLRWACLR
ncbi:hypothetical protein ABIA48_004043 [Pseudomonas sp. S30_BP2TU TE3576]